MVKLDHICRDTNVMLIFARSYGLSGFVPSSMKEHVVIESKPDHFLDDLRLNNPWPELKTLQDVHDLATVYLKVDQWFEFDDERMNIDRNTYQSVNEGGQSVSINGLEVGHVNDEDALMNVATSWPLSIAIDARETVKYDETLVDQKVRVCCLEDEVQVLEE
nr:NEDD8-activating enzyme E1 regulatory subunit AXR1-like [Tanacetum cinerariifolium]